MVSNVKSILRTSNKAEFGVEENLKEPFLILSQRYCAWNGLKSFDLKFKCLGIRVRVHLNNEENCASDEEE